MDAMLVVIVLAVLVEGIVQVVKTWTPEGANLPTWLWPVVSAGVGVVVCVAASVDVFTLLDISLSVPVLGAILTGVLISRGASFVHDLWNRVRGESLRGIGS